MRDPVKLRDSIIVGGLQYNRETIVDRTLVRGTRFDSPEYLIETDDPEFHEPAWNDRVEVNTDLEQNITGGATDPMMERIATKRKVVTKTVISPPPTEDEIVRPRFPVEVTEEEIEEVIKPRKVLVKKKLIRKH
jgi:hypothetical protein